MIRSKELIDILVADLHFHHYKEVSEGDIFGGGRTSLNTPYYDTLVSIGINPQVDLYHGGTVSTPHTDEYINQYVDDVFIDYFFRTYNFKEIRIPQQFALIQITPDGVKHPKSDIVLNLQNIYDRCTFVKNMTLFIGMSNKYNEKQPQRNFFQKLDLRDKTFGMHGDCTIIKCKLPFDYELDDYLNEYYPGRGIINPDFRTAEVLNYFKFIKSIHPRPYSSDISYTTNNDFFYMRHSYRDFKDDHLFGEYTIENIFIIYAALTEKFSLYKDTFLLVLLYCIDDLEKTIFSDFLQYERTHTDYHFFEPYIVSRDLYLRFTNRERSKAFTFERMNDAIDSVQLFNQPPVTHVRDSNTLPLPYLYHQLNLL